MAQDNTAAYRRMLVEGVIDRSLRAIQDDPRRGLRKLVDMGAACAFRNMNDCIWRLSEISYMPSLMDVLTAGTSMPQGLPDTYYAHSND